MDIRKNLKYIVGGFLIGTLVSTATMAFSANLDENIVAILSKEIKITFNGKPYQPMNDDSTPLYPIVYNGRTYLPVRYITNKLGGNIGWDDKTKTVKLWTDDYSTMPDIGGSQTTSKPIEGATATPLPAVTPTAVATPIVVPPPVPTAKPTAIPAPTSTPKPASAVPATPVPSESPSRIIQAAPTSTPIPLPPAP